MSAEPGRTRPPVPVAWPVTPDRPRGGRGLRVVYSWRGADGLDYHACDACLCSGYLLRRDAGDRNAYTESACPRCGGRGYLPRPAPVAPGRETGDAPETVSRESRSARALLISRKRCPVCIGAGRRLVLEDGGSGEVVIAGQPLCAACGGTGDLPSEANRQD